VCWCIVCEGRWDWGDERVDVGLVYKPTRGRVNRRIAEIDSGARNPRFRIKFRRMINIDK